MKARHSTEPRIATGNLRRPRIWSGDTRGFAMAGLLVAIGVMSVLLSVLVPAWSLLAKRERETELIFRGEQYARAIELYQRQYVGAYPTDLETLVDQRFLRRPYRDPMAAADEDGEFLMVFRSQLAQSSRDPDTPEEDRGNAGDRTLFFESEAGASGQPDGAAPSVDFSRPAQGGIVGVVSASLDDSLRVYNGGRKYSEWVFVYAPTEIQPGEGAGDNGIGSRESRQGPGGQPREDDRRLFGRGGR